MHDEDVWARVLADTGAPNGPDDPASLPDAWKWHTLSVDLGTVRSTARICVGLQSGNGAEAVFVDAFQLQATNATAPGCTPDAFPPAAGRIAGLPAMLGRPTSCGDDGGGSSGGGDGGMPPMGAYGTGTGPNPAQAFLLVMGPICAITALAVLLYTFFTSDNFASAAARYPALRELSMARVPDPRLAPHMEEQDGIIDALLSLSGRLQDGAAGEEPLCTPDFQAMLARVEAAQTQFRAVLEGGHLDKEEQQRLVSQSQTMLDLLSRVMAMGGGAGAAGAVDGAQAHV